MKSSRLDQGRNDQKLQNVRTILFLVIYCELDA